MTLTAFFAQGHLLLDDVPGIGKTLLGQALARSINASFARIQFTSDLLPADVIGGDFYNQKTQEFQFERGPIFANIVLADEVNRTPPRTQSATLEAMSERQTSVGGKTYELPNPFFVVATQNPVEFQGVYPLPEAQLDRFIMRLSVGYPNRQAERMILDAHASGSALGSISPVIELADALAIQNCVPEVTLESSVTDYLLEIVESTRRVDDLALGASPRASLAFARAVRAYALVQGRDYVVPDDVKALAVPVLAHRILPRNVRREESQHVAVSFLERALASIPAPR